MKSIQALFLGLLLLTPSLTFADYGTPVTDTFDSGLVGWNVACSYFGGCSPVSAVATTTSTYRNSPGAITLAPGAITGIAKAGSPVSEGSEVVYVKDSSFPNLVSHWEFRVCTNLSLDDGGCVGDSFHVRQGVNVGQPVPKDGYYHSVLIAWRNGSQYKESCKLIDSIDTSNCSWTSSGYPLTDTFSGVSISGALQNTLYGIPIDYGDIYFDNLGNGTTATTTPPPCTVDCNDNVLFLPGIEGSRLYRPDYNGGTKPLWEPQGDSSGRDLYLNPDGSSSRFDIYTKDVIDEAYAPLVGPNIYKSFLGKMKGLKDTGKIVDWESAPYDWRLALDDILNYGNQLPDGRLYYSSDLKATSTPYVIQELKKLASTSRTGKVTIVAHSNGGLVAKALMIKLGPDASKYVDKIIMVDVPQIGTPEAIGALLHGEDQGLPSFGYNFLLSKPVARAFAQNAPVVYNLLPSANYFTYVDDAPISIDPASLPTWVSQYGSTIHSQDRLDNFLTGTIDRVASTSTDLLRPTQANATLINQSNTMHAFLDSWTPPTGVQLIQIAGWGIPTTISGISYAQTTQPSCPPALGGACVPAGQRILSASTTIDGDGTVVTPSQLWTSTTTGAMNYWVDLEKYNSPINRTLRVSLLPTKHADILEVPDLYNFISSSVTSSVINLADYPFLFTKIPPSSGIRLRYSLHSPLTLNLYDNQGHHTGVSTTTGAVEEQIPGTYYMEFGDVKYLFTDASTTSHIVMNGYATSTFTFNVDQLQGDTLTATTTFKDIPVTPQTTVTLNTASDITTVSPMTLNLDNTHTYTITPKANATVTLDTTPPEIQLTFSTSTNSLTYIATDDSGAVTATSTTILPVVIQKKKGKDDDDNRNKGIATTTITAKDQAGNTTILVYTEQLPNKDRRISITPLSISYNGAATTLSKTQLKYKWQINSGTSNIYKMFASYIQTSSTSTESHFRPKKNQTILMIKPVDINDDDSDEDADARPTKVRLPGFVVPYLITKQGKIIISY